ncbi:MAG TPA: long-chain fatty acid--CoA ligase [Actinomycetota bacterium]|nr:long-chain fatty acid--CoA ligase [Actinomycetota bacterium]
MSDHRPWYRHYPEGVPRTLEPYPEVSAFSMLAGAAARHPDRPAIAWFGRHISYRDLLREVERCSAGLARLGVRKGDRVGLLLPNCPQYVIAYYATLRLGAVVVGNNPLYTQRELTHQLEDAGCSVLIALDRFYPTVEAVRREVGDPEVVYTKLTDHMPFPLNLLAPIKLRREAKHEGAPWPPVPKGAPVRWWRRLLEEAGAPPPPAVVEPRTDPAGFIYTGGTTGLAKAAILSHFNLVANAMQSAAWFPDLGDGTDAMMCVLPFFHSYGMTVCMNVSVYRAAKMILVPRFELHMVLKQIQKEKPTLFPGVPRLYIALNEAPETRRFDLRSIKACLSGAAPLPAAVAERFREITGGARLVEGYGLTECSPVTHANPIYGRAKEGSIGMPIPDTDCKIVSLDDPDREVPVGQEGELCIRGPQVMLGYWKRPEETALAIRNGWFHTGDVARMDEDGYFSIVDRIKEMIIVSGFNVYPTEVEQVLYRHPKVHKVSVVGVPDATTGEAVKAFVVLKPGETATAEEIVAWCRDPSQGLTGYRVPRHVEFRDSLPETLIGKVLRRVLLEEERQRAGAAP